MTNLVINHLFETVANSQKCGTPNLPIFEKKCMPGEKMSPGKLFFVSLGYQIFMSLQLILMKLHSFNKFGMIN